MTMTLRHPISLLAIAGITILGPLAASAQQRAHFSQYLFSGLVINPAYTGADEALSLTMVDRHQWRGLAGAPSTLTLALHGAVRHKKIGLGLLASSDRIGVHSHSSLQTSYAFHLPAGDRSFLSMGLLAGFSQLRSNYALLTNPAAADPRIPDFQVNQIFPELGAGLYFRSPRFHGGLSSPELLTKRVRIGEGTSLTMGSATLLAFARYRFSAGPAWDVEPGVLLKYFHRLPVSLDVMVSAAYRRILTAGISFRQKESVTVLLRARVNQQLEFGYSYSYPVGHMAWLPYGSHEIMVHYIFHYRRTGVQSSRP